MTGDGEGGLVAGGLITRGGGGGGAFENVITASSFSGHWPTIWRLMCAFALRTR